MLYDPATGTYDRPDVRRALAGRIRIATAEGQVECRPAFDLYADLCRRYSPERVEEICWVPAAQVGETARLLWQSRPVAWYAWSGVGQHTNATPTDRAIGLLNALTGSYDAPGGNVTYSKAPTNDVSGAELLSDRQRARALGADERPLGPPGQGWVTTRDFCHAVLEGRPYPVRGLVGFGSNMLLSQADTTRTRDALLTLEFYVHIDLFMTPTAAFADLVLPATTPWEREGLRIGFEIDQAAEELVQLRAPVVEPFGEARSDTQIVFDLAVRLGLGNGFWDGDLDAGLRHQLAPSGLTPEVLRAKPEGVHVALETRHRKYADGAGFRTPTRKVEIYSERLLRHGYTPLPEFVEPAAGPASRPDLAVHYPLVLTSAKSPQFCQSQHRGLPSQRRRVPDPLLEIHPLAAESRGIGDGDWVAIETPAGRIRARARLTGGLDYRVVCGQHGWWQGCRALDLPDYDPLGAGGANYNALVSSDASDPVSGSVPLRSQLCEVRRLDPSGD